MALIHTFPPKESESGFGYYRRLASRNFLTGWRELAGLASVSRHPTGLLGQPIHVAVELGLEASWSQLACDQEERSRSWRGMHRSRNDAICPECLKDDIFLRDYWEHVYVTACPSHRVQLIDRCPACGDVLSSNRERIEQCPCGTDLRALPAKIASPYQIWLSALISSNGFSSAGIVPNLKGARILDICEVVRVLCLHKDPKAAPPRRNAAHPKSIQEAIELLQPLETLLTDWPTAFERHVQERVQAGTPNARTLNKLLGRWYLDIRKTCSTGPMKTFLEAILRVASDSFDGTLGLDSAKSLATQVSEYALLKDAARAIGVSRDTLLKAALSGGCQYRTRRFGTRGLTYEIPSVEVKRICASRADWVGEEEACSFAGVSLAVLQHMAHAKVIDADFKWKSDIVKGGMFDMRSLIELTSRINSRVVHKGSQHAEIITWSELTSRRMGDKQAIRTAMQAASTGELLPVVKGRQLGQIGFLRCEVRAYFGTPLLEAGLAINQLSNLTGWKWESINHWIELGLLDSNSIILRGQSCKVVSPEQLLSFARTYVPLADLARSLDSRSSFLIERLSDLEILGGKPLPNGTQRGALIRLADLAKLAVGARGVSKLVGKY